MDKDTLAEDKEAFSQVVDAESQQRKDSLEDLKFARLGDQWHEKDRQSREADGRPCLTVNRMPSFAKQVLNDARQNRPAIRVHPAGDGAVKETADIYNGLIRNIETVSRAGIAYDTALESAVYGGIGYFVIRNDYTCEDSFDQDLVIERVGNPFSIYGDPRSKEADSSDWNSAFITDMLSEAEFKRRWPGASLQGFQGDRDESSDLWFEDKSIRVAERWKRDEVEARLLKLSTGAIMFEDKYLEMKDFFDVQGITVEGDRKTKTYKVIQRIISGSEILETNDWAGKYIPIVPVYGEEVNVEGKRTFQGLFKFAKDPQRMFNYWRTASTELVALAPKAPYIGAVGQFVTDAAKWQTANNATHSHIEYDLVPNAAPPQRQPFTGVPAGALQEALNAADDMKAILGIYDASLGARSNETSGKAIMARQREGDTSTFNFIDNLSRGIEHAGRILVDLIPKTYTVPRIVRCIKEDGSTYAVPVNQPVVPAPPKEGEVQAPGQPQEAFEPVSEEIEGITKMFDLTTGKYDVTVAVGPSFTTKRQEASESMMEFIRVFPQSAPLIGDLLAKNQDWPGAEEIAARLKAMLPAQAAGGPNPQVQQLTQQLQQQDQMAKEAVGQLRGELEQTKKQLEDKTVEQQINAEKVRIDGVNAETERIKVLSDIQNAEKDRQARMIEQANSAAMAQDQANRDDANRAQDRMQAQSSAEQAPAA